MLAAAGGDDDQDDEAAAMPQMRVRDGVVATQLFLAPRPAR